jgi:hypothetical protein
MDFATRRHAAAGLAHPGPLDLACLVGAAGWRRLPAAVRRRFAAGHADTAYHGTLDLHCSALGRCFAAISGVVGGPLTTLRRRGVAAEVRVHADGCGGVVWERRLRLLSDADVRVVRSTKEVGRDGGLVERTDGGLAMALDVFEEGGALVFESRRYFFVLGRLRLPISGCLTPGTCRVEHHDLGGGRFRFTLSMVHPWWGRTFHQTGVFAEPKEAFP